MATPIELPAIDFDRFHREDLPRLLAAGRGPIAAHAAHGQGPLAIRLSGAGAYTYTAGPDGIGIAPGSDAADTVIELDLESWRGLVVEVEAAAGLLYSGRAHCPRGRAIDLMSWEAGLRALYNGHPAYDPARIDLRDRAGAPLDVERTFDATDDPGEMAHFLRTAGYLFVRDVFRPEEVAAFRAEAADLRGAARKGDQLSWWGRNATGDEVLCRVTCAGARPRLGTLPTDPRILSLIALADEPLVHSLGEGDGVTVIYKTPGMVEGLSDIPWHRDCGMGGHASMCPTVIASVFLTPATAESGDLRMLPGSRSASYNAHLAPPPGFRPASFRAGPGDVSLHYGDTVHAAPPPTRSDLPEYRISAILGFSPNRARHHRGEKSYNQVLHQRDDGQVEHLEAVAGRRGAPEGRPGS